MALAGAAVAVAVAVAVEKIFNIPGLGRLALGAAIAQDLPPRQTATPALVLLGVAAGLLIQALRRALRATVRDVRVRGVRVRRRRVWTAVREPGVRAERIARTVKEEGG
ncbi:hypothetical protein ADL12_17075 [Streptomyces regalis]|uniref:ABC transmembrane type-1 domain-containing protein n=1 Tax=Streptomyces regalis TaxID=68262 RepID=A0A0X3V4Y1_9ACTN|nr:hypothetical protein ADL12_17075 [Streptomyces regalis]